MKVKVMLLAILLCLISAVAVQAQSLPSAKPEQVGLSSERLQRITDTLKADVEKRIIPGAVVLVARHGKAAFFETVGVLDPATKVPMRKDAIFRIYPMSTAVPSLA